MEKKDRRNELLATGLLVGDIALALAYIGWKLAIKDYGNAWAMAIPQVGAWGLIAWAMLQGNRKK